MRICDKCESKVGVHDCKVVLDLVNQNNLDKRVELCTPCSSALDSMLKHTLNQFFSAAKVTAKPRLHKPKKKRTA